MRKKRRTTPVEERFERYFERGPGCWLWTGSTQPKGYGQINRGDGVPERAHRVAWTKFRGPIPEGLQVLHRCDNPGCVNPDHLFLGTDGDNMHDKQGKGRHHKQILSAADVAEIRAAPRYTRFNAAAFAARLGVTISCIKQVRARSSWKKF
jgi:HNH endonuclease